MPPATGAGVIYGFSAPLLDGRTVCLEQFRGEVLLIVNTASQCGFTPQYEGLEGLYRSYKNRGFAVLAFPCNQFGAQEPGTPDEIGAFCRRNYEVSFPIFARIEVNGPNAHPLFRFLKYCRPGIFGIGRIQWNFTKFLIDREGSVLRRYAPNKQPKAISPAIERTLDCRPKR